MASMMQTGYGTGSRVGPWVHKQCHNKKIGSHYYRMRELYFILFIQRGGVTFETQLRQKSE